MVDAPDLKSVVRMGVGVQVPPLAPRKRHNLLILLSNSFFGDFLSTILSPNFKLLASVLL